MSHITADSTPAEVREHWAAALESGDYAQAHGQLADGDGDGGFCCLGVACDLAVKAGVIDSFEPSHADLDDGYAPVKHWLGLRVGDGNYTGSSLAADNDLGETFAEIAATIRSAPENLFAD